jgi:sulfite oxidase
VDVSTDGGQSWRQADLAPVISPWAWRLWSIEADLPSGEVDIVARAWDSTAALQPESPEHVWNPKGYVNNSWPRISVTVDHTV